LRLQAEQFELWADRASSATMAADQLRLWFAAIAYILVNAMRRIALRDIQFADAAVATIRLKLLKLGARVSTSVRRIHFAIASSCPSGCAAMTPTMPMTPPMVA
jgi:hypothetical protein